MSAVPPAGTRERLSLADVEAYDPRARRTAKRLRARCPLHGGDHQQSFSADLETGAYCCHACGATGKLTDYWKDQLAPRRDERLILHRAPAKAPPRPTEPDDMRKRPSPEAETRLECLPAWQAALPGSPGVAYLAKRGIPLPIAREHGLGWAAPGVWPNGDPAYGYLVFPLSAGAYARAVHPDYPRRDATKASRHRKAFGAAGLFNAGLLEQPPAWLHICEAPLDALTLVVHGRPAVALVGTALAGHRGMFRRCAGLLVALDDDVAGDKATAALAAALRPRGVRVLRLPRAALGGADDLNAAHMAGVLRLPPPPAAADGGAPRGSRGRLADGTEVEIVAPALPASTATCPVCGGEAWWQRPAEVGGDAVCARCHPYPKGGSQGELLGPGTHVDGHLADRCRRAVR